jgi:1A family penicillin-binding protein
MRTLLQLFFLTIILAIKIEDVVGYIYTKTKKSFPPKKRKKNKKEKAQHFASTFRTKLKYFLIGVIFSFFFLFIPLATIIFLQDLPSPTELTYRQIPQTTRIYDRNNSLLAEIYTNQDRTIVPLSDIPTSLKQATISIEDKNFYTHPGFDIPSIVRAFKQDLSGGKIQGGSTITQQLIKSSILTPEQNLSRKIKEVILAFWTEKIYTKNQILEMYFNQVPYGGTAWGAEAAAETYFNKHVKQLDLAQSAFLAGLTSAPTIYSPYGNQPNLWKKRQKEVLQRMVANQYITPKQASIAEKENITFSWQNAALHAPHFVNYVKQLIAEKYGQAMLEKGGLNIYTTLDLKIQNMAERVVKTEVSNDATLNLTNGAAVITNPQNGDILALVGSHDFNDPNGGNVNIATSLRQPGSSIKVVTYSAALENGFTAASILDDSPVSYPSDSGAYAPVNYDGRFHGRVPLRIALANSFNIPAVKTLNQIGIPTMVDTAKKMGITTWGDPSQYGLSITLGSAEVTMLDMATVYGTLANKGQRVDLNPILKVTDSKGHTLEQKSQPQKTQVLTPGVSYILSDILADNNARTLEFGPNSPLYIPGQYVSVKTGTTDDKRDNWTDGYTSNYVVITWVGNNDNTPMSPTLASGITGAAPIWHQIMTNLLTNQKITRPTPPTQIVSKTCYGHPEYFLNGTQNTTNCGYYIPSPTRIISK